MSVCFIFETTLQVSMKFCVSYRADLVLVLYVSRMSVTYNVNMIRIRKFCLKRFSTW